MYLEGTSPSEAPPKVLRSGPWSQVSMCGLSVSNLDRPSSGLHCIVGESVCAKVPPGKQAC